MSDSPDITHPKSLASAGLSSFRDGRRFRVFKSRSCICAGFYSECWQARCECGTFLTKHDYTAEDAALGAREVLASDDPRPGFGHARCK